MFGLTGLTAEASENRMGGKGWIVFRLASQFITYGEVSEFSNQRYVFFDNDFVGQSRLKRVGRKFGIFERGTPSQPKMRIPIGLPYPGFAFKTLTSGRSPAVFCCKAFDLVEYAFLIHCLFARESDTGVPS